ncbi:CRR6 family NdhI maturation factor [Romeria aff. gracilis LEGE 07310]|uniref:CRR6 family NdhI maturation factor n=1 Tax=Vasconcelosia minhoensis LEGE 07310 TaxID=915328 RepID=A0A8J7DLB4_9CYAN|nr:CRR6 family NdhI maturation factor [Romeria gracilis]MBE9077121.1 CRR6 family NdhI maturation factor [Romeria aff. gracilis LEGE 07310]
MTYAIALTDQHCHSLDLTPAQQVIEPLLSQQAFDSTLTLKFDIDYPREPTDPRELSELPEVRLWFVRADSRYPWLPLYLDWESGELGRYAAMLVPHQFSPLDGIRYNPEALELFVMRKVFEIDQWLRNRQIEGRSRLKLMTQILGYELNDGLFQLL